MSAIFGETLTFPQENGPEVELVVFGDEFFPAAKPRTVTPSSTIEIADSTAMPSY